MTDCTLSVETEEIIKYRTENHRHPYDFTAENPVGFLNYTEMSTNSNNVLNYATEWFDLYSHTMPGLSSLGLIFFFNISG